MTVRQPQDNKETRSPVLAAVLTGPPLATCSTKENTARPFGATCLFDQLGFGRCEADAQDDAAAFVGRERWSAGAGHDMNIAGHRKFVNGVDATDLRGHDKTMTTYTQQGDTIIATDEGGDWVFGKLMNEDSETWIGCQTCGDQITAVDAGMCHACREDLAWRERF